MPTHTIAIVSDTHADERSRWDEHCRVMDWIVADMAKRNVACTRDNVMIVTGSQQGLDLLDALGDPRQRDHVEVRVRHARAGEVDRAARRAVS